MSLSRTTTARGAATPGDTVMTQMKMYKEKWQKDYPSNMTQTDMFRKWVPKEPVDFTETYRSIGFDQIFTSDKVCLKMMGPYNSNMLYRDSLGECKIPIYNDGEFTVQGPMGIPGVHLGDKHGSKASHLMIVRHTEDGPVTFNEMLPSTPDETADLKKRLDVLDLAVKNIRDNVLISECGPKVMRRATRGWAKDGEPDQPLGDVATMTIRDYMVNVITKMPEDIRNGRPGYVLKDSEDHDVTLYPVSIRHLIDTLYDAENMKTFKAIQPPTENSQFLSHIHCFQLPDGVVPECMQNTYFDCELIYKNKLLLQAEDDEEIEEEVDEGATLGRQRSAPPPVEDVLNRQMSPVPPVASC
uniref:Uncharacterized protein n=1 Tax=viral metagenome TaxID=1070528 RepID=A0A6C0FDA7_9ZZZZ|tara:strand:- start:10765 stop:11832 length:1068 start_codon:yes stop_codon:yes gene_type:complete